MNHPSKRKAGFLNTFSNPANIMEQWYFFQKIPLGKHLFSKLIGLMIPYTGSINPLVNKISPGNVEISLRDCRKVRNHLHSIHAIALANIGEFASGLALFSRAPSNALAIITKLEVNYIKKARGNLIANAQFTDVNFQDNAEHVIKTDIKNMAGETVATAHATWRIRIMDR